MSRPTPVKYTEALRSLINALRSKRYEERLQAINRRCVNVYGLRIIQGPFGGMVYTKESTGSEFAPKLLGTYEFELNEVISEVIRIRPKLILDIGCAEGYYAVGLAYRCPGARVLAFDTNEVARRLCGELAQLNGVAERIEIQPECTSATLASLDLTGAVIVCDCEGCEIALLDPAQVPQLSRCSILVELHDFANPAITPCLLGRFGKTHDIQLIDSRRPNPDLTPALWFLKNRRDREIALHEKRVPMQWAWMKPV